MARVRGTMHGGDGWVEDRFYNNGKKIEQLE